MLSLPGPADPKALRALDTPTVCNALTLVAPARRAIGFKCRPLFAAFPEPTPVVALARTATDVWWHYPNAAEPEHRPSRPFHELPNVIMTPHCSGWTEGMVGRGWAKVAANINRFIPGEPLENGGCRLTTRD